MTATKLGWFLIRLPPAAQRDLARLLLDAAKAAPGAARAGTGDRLGDACGLHPETSRNGRCLADAAPGEALVVTNGRKMCLVDAAAFASLLQVALPDDIHMELSILAKRKRATLSELVKDALNLWLKTNGHELRVP